MRAGACNAIGCRAAILPTQCFCERHINMLPTDVCRLVERSFRPGKKHSERFKRALEHARREILVFVTHGHHVPRDRPFEWDDDDTRF